jgi:hypothetical protein
MDASLDDKKKSLTIFVLNPQLMQQLITDFKILIKNNWKFILMIAVVLYLLNSYQDIKQGIIDGWANK